MLRYFSKPFFRKYIPAKKNYPCFALEKSARLAVELVMVTLGLTVVTVEQHAHANQAGPDHRHLFTASPSL